MSIYREYLECIRIKKNKYHEEEKPVLQLTRRQAYALPSNCPAIVYDPCVTHPLVALALLKQTALDLIPSGGFSLHK